MQVAPTPAEHGNHVKGLLTAVLTGVETFGIDNLSEFINSQCIGLNVRITNIISSVAEVMECDVHEMKYGKGRKNGRRKAIGYCSYFLFRDKELKLSNKDISRILNCTPTRACRYRMEIERLKETDRIDAVYIQKRILIEEKIFQAEYQINNLNQTQPPTV